MNKPEIRIIAKSDNGITMSVRIGDTTFRSREAPDGLECHYCSVDRAFPYQDIGSHYFCPGACRCLEKEDPLYSALKEAADEEDSKTGQE